MPIFPAPPLSCLGQSPGGGDKAERSETSIRGSVRVARCPLCRDRLFLLGYSGSSLPGSLVAAVGSPAGMDWSATGESEVVLLGSEPRSIMLARPPGQATAVGIQPHFRCVFGCALMCKPMHFSCTSECTGASGSVFLLAFNFITCKRLAHGVYRPRVHASAHDEVLERALNKTHPTA